MSDDAPASPKRRHILSSINPELADAHTLEGSSRRRRRHHRPSRSRSRERRSDRKHETLSEAGDDDGDPTRPRPSRLKLKSDSKRREHSRDRQRSSRRHHHRSSRRRSRSPTPPNPHHPPPLTADEAFRQSLFDAMADDEGAAYWEGVYGQPMHVYSDEKVGPQGELERMTDDEYAAHVRQKMWEKTHAGLIEERARRDEQKKKREKDEKQSRLLREEMERSIKRGEERRLRRSWERRWDDYSQAWAGWDGSPETLAWPLQGGRPKEGEDADPGDVRAFFVQGLELDKLGYEEFVAKLKDERVRWHPDKVQQRLGGKVDERIIKDVTAIFQIIDRLWTEMRDKASKASMI